ncbi:hypothetical protein ACGFZQ_09830 [Streptomyces sp. NPDC048254]|uniref:hypothetical protein n=1 Tax=Streptomyces sp. NPDC048254 TaxID=3365525 RepID=UPI00370FF0FD
MSVVGKVLLGILGVAVLAGVGIWSGIRHVASDISSHMITTAQFKGVHEGENRDAVRDRLGEPGGLQPQDKPKPPAGTTSRSGHAWQRFTLAWTPSSVGEHILACRATTRSGATQPSTPRRNRIHQRVVFVTQE